MLKRLLFVVLMSCATISQAAVYALPWGPKPQFVDANGAPMNAGTLTFFVAGTTTAQNTYTTQTGNVANSNPITLNSRGESPSEVWLTGGVSYKMVLKDSSGATVWTVDSISGVNDPAATVSEWITGPTPTYVSVNSFTLANDQTLTFTPGRRVKFTVTSGTVYGTIYTSSYVNPITTVTMVMDSSGNLDSGLSTAAYGLLAATNPSIPAISQETLASATTVTLASARGESLHVSGVTTITGFGNAPSGLRRIVTFDGALTLTHNGTSLILPGAANITTAAGDTGIFISEGSGNWRCVGYVGRNASFNNVLAAGTLGVTGTSTVAAVNESGDLNINSGKFTVTASNGNTAAAGTLNVTGASTLTGNVSAATGTGGSLTIAASGTGNATLQLGPTSPSANGGSFVEFINSSTQKNFAIGFNQTVAGALEIFPSTAAGGSTFSTNQAMFTPQGYFKASNSGSYQSSTGAWHESVTNADSRVHGFTNSSGTLTNTVDGLYIFYSAAAPNSTGANFIYAEDNSALRFSVRSNGGIANFSANNVNLSDATVKTGLRPAGSYWNFIKRLQVVDGYYTDDVEAHGTGAKRRTMLTAQNVQEVERALRVSWMDSVVTPFDDKGHLGVQEHSIGMRHLRVTQELQARVEKLEALVQRLEARLAANDAQYKVAAGK